MVRLVLKGGREMTNKEKCCAKCVYCQEDFAEGFLYEYEGYCNKTGYFLKTINDRLCEEFEEDLG